MTPAAGIVLRLAAVVTMCGACHGPRESFLTNPHASEALRAELSARPAGEIAAVHNVWTQYLNSKKRGFDCAPSVLWLASEQGTWILPSGRSVERCYDLAGLLIDPRMKPEVLSIQSVRNAERPTYRITTRFRLADADATGRRPHAGIETVYAVKQGVDWKLAGALGQATRTWRHETVGPFTYIVHPKHKFSRVRAQQAVAFADSVANALGVPHIRPMLYYIMPNGDEMIHTYGFVPDTIYGTPGGQTINGAIISADAVFAEKHGHEIAHNLVQVLQGSRLSIVASEGVPTWIGGTRSMEYPEALRALRTHLLAHPEATLDTVISSNFNAMHNPGGALLAAMVFERGGVKAIQQFLNSGPSMSDLRTGVEEILGMSWANVAADWKRRALAAK